MIALKATMENGSKKIVLRKCDNDEINKNEESSCGI